MPLGNYMVQFFLGTDEYTMGTYRDSVMIKVTRYTRARWYSMIGFVMLVVPIVVWRFFWIRRVNTRKERRKHHSGKAVSRYYYKK
jgi:hypothetical protein